MLLSISHVQVTILVSDLSFDLENIAYDDCGIAARIRKMFERSDKVEEKWEFEDRQRPTTSGESYFAPYTDKTSSL